MVYEHDAMTYDLIPFSTEKKTGKSYKYCLTYLYNSFNTNLDSATILGNNPRCQKLNWCSVDSDLF